jgi:hypothetical protein
MAFIIPPVGEDSSGGWNMVSGSGYCKPWWMANEANFQRMALDSSLVKAKKRRKRVSAKPPSAA